ncbi:saccharopine dehydrogenase NADP-binding domain-containing protein [Fusibacter sp. JL298sf-3]
MTLGIIGATGRVGRGTLAHVPPHFEVLLGGRNPEALKTSGKCLKGRYEAVPLDVYDAEGLAAFCKRCDVVVHAAAPAADIGCRVLDACIEAECSYIDPMGTQAVCKAARAQDKIVALTAVGAYPGLSEFLIGDAVRRVEGRAVAVDGYFQGDGAFSKKATADIVADMKSGTGMAFYQYTDGEAVPFNPAPKGGQPEGRCAYPVVNDSFLAVCRRHGFNRGTFYNCFLNSELMNTFFEVAIAMKHDAAMTTERATERLYATYRTHASEVPMTQYIYYVTTADGRCEKTVYRFHMDWNVLTGQVCAILAGVAASGTLATGGCDFGTLDDVPEVVAALESSGALTCTQTAL